MDPNNKPSIFFLFWYVCFFVYLFFYFFYVSQTQTYSLDRKELCHA